MQQLIDSISVSGNLRIAPDWPGQRQSVANTAIFQSHMRLGRAGDGGPSSPGSKIRVQFITSTINFF